MSELHASGLRIVSRRLSSREEIEAYRAALCEYRNIDPETATFQLSAVVHEQQAPRPTATAAARILLHMLRVQADEREMSLQRQDRLQVATLQYPARGSAGTLTTVVYVANRILSENTSEPMYGPTLEPIHEDAIPRANADLAAFSQPDAYRFSWPEQNASREFPRLQAP